MKKEPLVHKPFVKGFVGRGQNAGWQRSTRQRPGSFGRAAHNLWKPLIRFQPDPHADPRSTMGPRQCGNYDASAAEHHPFSTTVQSETVYATSLRGLRGRCLRPSFWNLSREIVSECEARKLEKCRCVGVPC